MPIQFSFGKIQFDLSPGSDAARVRRTPDSPFRLAVLGDFTGRSSRGVIEPLASRRLLPVDCDNLESVMRSLGATVRLPATEGASAGMDVRFGSLDDFHPDRLIHQIPWLAALDRARERLGNPATAASAIAEAQQILDTAPRATSAAASGAAAESIQETMARLLGGSPPPTVPANKPAAGGVDIRALIKSVVAPHVVPGATPEQSSALAAVEMELSAKLRAVLHHPGFQAVEATWRGLDLLVRAHGGEGDLKLHVMDVSKEELMADVRGQENLAQSAFSRALGEEGLAAIIGAFSFDDSLEDIETLGRLSKIAFLHGAALVAGGSSHLVGCDSLTAHPDPFDWTRRMTTESEAAWAELRRLSEARSLGLVFPRVLLRQPYGKGSDPIETFPFEEMTREARHESFLWGSGAFVAAHLLADSFLAEGWDIAVGGPGDLDDLPVFTFAEDGEARIKPCAEVWLSERAGERILELGLIPLLSIKGRGAVRLGGLQSVARPAAALFLQRG